jgi:hypothetical protein
MSAADPRLARIAELRREAALDRLLGNQLIHQDSTPRPRSCDRDLAAEAASLFRQADLADRLAAEIEREAELERLRLAVQLAAGRLQEAHRVDDWSAGQAAIRAAHQEMTLAALELHLFQRRERLAIHATPERRAAAAAELREIFPAATTWPAALERLEAALAKL